MQRAAESFPARCIPPSDCYFLFSKAIKLAKIPLRAVHFFGCNPTDRFGFVTKSENGLWPALPSSGPRIWTLLYSAEGEICMTRRSAFLGNAHLLLLALPLAILPVSSAAQQP